MKPFFPHRASAFSVRSWKPVRRRPAAPRPRAFRPQLESLESRNLLSFAPAVSYLTGPAGTDTKPTFVVAGLFSQDNNLDLAVANGATNTVTVLTGKGDGTFNAPAAPTATGGLQPVALAAARLVAGDRLDLVVANNGQLLTKTGTNAGNVNVLLGNGDGTFRPGPTFPGVGPSPAGVVLADLNNDNRPDAVITSVANPNVSDPLNHPPTSGSVSVLRGNGDGSFTTLQTISLALPTGGLASYAFPTSSVVGDLDGDTIPDLAVTGETVNVSFDLSTFTVKLAYSSTLQVFRGKGDGTFNDSPAFTTTTFGDYPSALAVGHFDGDSWPDLVAVNNNLGSSDSSKNTVTVLLNRSSAGAVSFTRGPGTPIVVGSHPLFVAVGKLAPDGNDDLVVSNNGANTVSILLGNGTGAFAPEAHSPYATGNSPSGIAVGSFKPYGQQDLAVVSSGSDTISVLLNQVATKTTVQASASPVVYGQQVTLSAVVTAPGWSSTTTPGGTVTFMDGSTVLGTRTLTSSGVATYITGASQLAVGSHSITAVYTSDGPHAGSSSLPLGLTVNVDPTTMTLASSVNPSVYGQPISFIATVTATSPGSGTPTGTVTFTLDGQSIGSGTLNGGVATLKLPANFAALGEGSHTVQANYATDGNYAGNTVAPLTQTIKLGFPATIGTNFNGMVGSVFGLNPAAKATDLTITISWSNNPAPSQGHATPNNAGGFDITGTNSVAYTAEGRYPVTVQISDPQGDSRTLATVAHVARLSPPPVSLYPWALNFTHGPEYYRDFISGVYQRFLHRPPDAGGLSYWISAMQSGMTDEQVEANFISSVEYIGGHGGLGAGWVTALYLDLLNRLPSAGDVQGWVQRIPQDGAYGIAIFFATCQERQRDVITFDYQHYLGRTPAPSEVLGWMQQGLPNEIVINYMLSAPEYFALNYDNIGDWIWSTYQKVLGRAPRDDEYQNWLSLLKNVP